MIIAWTRKIWQQHGWRPLIIAARCAMAALLAVEVSRCLGLQFPIYALISAIMVTEYHGHETRQQSVVRFIGNALGITAGGLLGTLFGGHALVIGLATFIMVLFCYFFDFAVAAKYSAFVAALTVMDHSTRPWSYGWDRLAETSLGIGFAFTMSLVIPVPKPKEGERPLSGTSE